MTQQRRRELIAEIEAAREGRMLIVYVTSTRTGFDVQMADDVLRIIYDHLESDPAKAERGIDLFIHSNGGSGTTPWRLVSVLREYTKKVAVIVPHKAFSAATLTALGADQIIMHRMGCLGPIDPSVTNAFNPANPSGQGLIPISVEDVTAYLKLVKDEVEIHHEDELIQAFKALTDRIHPLALGNVQRSHNQSRMMARKLLKNHMASETSEHEISQIIDNLKSNLFFHGHPINRAEAKNDLKLKVEMAAGRLEKAIWDLYLEYETELKLTEPYMPSHELDVRASPPAPAVPVTTQDIVNQIRQMAAAGVGVGTVTDAQLVNLAVAMLPHVQGHASPPSPHRMALAGAYIESTQRTDIFRTDLTIQRTMISTPTGQQEGIKQEIIWQRWEREP